jgi:hypothetical protein
MTVSMVAAAGCTHRSGKAKWVAETVAHIALGRCGNGPSFALAGLTVPAEIA